MNNTVSPSVVTLAASVNNTVPSSVVTFVASVTNEIINPIIGVIFAAALVYFLWGLMVFIFNAGEEAKIADGKRHMLWGIIGMTIMVSVYGILAIGVATLGISNSDMPNQINF